MGQIREGHPEEAFDSFGLQIAPEGRLFKYSIRGRSDQCSLTGMLFFFFLAKADPEGRESESF